MGDIDYLFDELLEEKKINSSNIADKIIISTENEFGSNRNHLLDEEESRITEEEELKEKRKKLTIKLNKHKNIKNPKLAHLNKKRSEKREKIKKEIHEINLRLQEIDMERKK